MFITAGNDFSLRYVVTEATYTQDETIWVDVDLTQCSNIQVFLDCEEHDIHIPLDWSLEENTNNVIIANVVASTLHIGTTYGTTVTGLDANGKAFRWNCDGSDFISIVEDTNAMNLEGPTELDDIHVKIGLVSPQGPQGAQGSAGKDGLDGVQGAQGSIGNQGAQGNQGEIGYQGSKGDIGITGAQGDMGQQGSRGNQGEKGDQGAKGDRGITGFQGDAGNQGNQGEQGNQGAQGEKGDQGTAGIGFRLGENNQYYVDNHVHITNGDSLTFANEEHPYEDPSGSILFASKEMGLDYPQVAINVKGLNNVEGSIYANDYHYYDEIGGSTKSIKNRINDLRTRVSTLEESGVQGPQGDKGVDGYQGRDGAQGAKGAQGEMGYQGNQGNIGIAGIQGDMGQQGSRGFQGDAGVQGSKGDRGATGYQGDAGAQGLRGIAGAQGNQGDIGPQGSCRFEDLTPQEKESLKGAQGSQGRVGNQGEQGVQGQRGEKGYQGEAGVGTQGVKGYQGDKGDRGVIGYQGDAGAQGNMGVQGAKGDRGPQGYGAASPAAEFPKVFIRWIPAAPYGVELLLDILYGNKSYYKITDLFYDKFGLTEEIDANVAANTGPSSTTGAYDIMVFGDFDYLQLVSNSNGIHLAKNANTTKIPTWIAITIHCKASLFDIDHTPYGDSLNDMCTLMSYTYIDLSQAWNPNT